MINEQRIEEIAEEYGTPFYLIDCDRLRNQYDKIQSSFPEGMDIAYAMKANYTPSVIQTFRDIGSNFDVFSPGELRLLLMNDCDPKKVVYTSVAETKSEFEYALDAGVKRFVLGSLKGIENFAEAERERNIDDLTLMIRIQPLSQIEAFVSTSGRNSKFGVTFSGDGDSVQKAIEKFRNLDLKLNGYHFHLGSQVKGSEYYSKSIEKSLNHASSKSVDVDVLDIGGGYPVRYNSNVESIESYGKGIGNVVEKWRNRMGGFDLIAEPGRFLTANSTVFVGEVVNVKRMYGRKIAIIDGSNDMVTVDRHDVSLDMEVIPDRGGSAKTAIAGNFCHSADWILEKAEEMADVKCGDLILFKNVGAYVMNHNIPYNLRNLPKVLSLDGSGLNSEKHPFQIIREVGDAYQP